MNRRIVMTKIPCNLLGNGLEQISFGLDAETEAKVQKRIRELGLSFEEGINFLLKEVATPHKRRDARFGETQSTRKTVTRKNK